jgi:histidyl-tRNA synthetase
VTDDKEEDGQAAVNTFQAAKGTFDLFPPDSAAFLAVRETADRSGACYALVTGERGLTAGVVQLKNLASGEQVPVPIDRIIPTIKEKLS